MSQGSEITLKHWLSLAAFLQGYDKIFGGFAKIWFAGRWWLLLASVYVVAILKGG